ARAKGSNAPSRDAPQHAATVRSRPEPPGFSTPSGPPIYGYGAARERAAAVRLVRAGERDPDRAARPWPRTPVPDPDEPARARSGRERSRRDRERGDRAGARGPRARKAPHARRARRARHDDAPVDEVGERPAPPASRQHGHRRLRRGE